MNAGRDYAKACRQAQANADWSRQPRYLLFANGVWWVEREPSSGMARTFYPSGSHPPSDSKGEQT